VERVKERKELPRGIEVQSDRPTKEVEKQFQKSLRPTGGEQMCF